MFFHKRCQQYLKVSLFHQNCTSETVIDNYHHGMSKFVTIMIKIKMDILDSDPSSAVARAVAVFVADFRDCLCGALTVADLLLGTAAAVHAGHLRVQIRRVQARADVDRHRGGAGDRIGRAGAVHALQRVDSAEGGRKHRFWGGRGGAAVDGGRSGSGQVVVGLGAL